MQEIDYARSVLLGLVCLLCRKTLLTFSVLNLLIILQLASDVIIDEAACV